MEDYNDLAAGPDENGRLNLSFHNWDAIPSNLFSHAFSLKVLDFTHNRFSYMPNDFGNLVAIRELNLAHNKLRRIEPITMLIRLRILNVSHNCLSSIPKDIARCTMLEVLTCNNNNLIEIPDSIGSLLVLETLRVDNNELKFLPSSITEISTLKEINCEGNTDLSSVPLDMRGRTDMILWCLQLQCHYHDKLTQKIATYDADIRSVRQCEELRIRVEETIEVNEHELHSLRNLIREFEPYVRRKSEAIKVRKRLKKAFQLLFRINCERGHSKTVTTTEAG